MLFINFFKKSLSSRENKESKKAKTLKSKKKNADKFNLFTRRTTFEIRIQKQTKVLFKFRFVVDPVSFYEYALTR